MKTQMLASAVASVLSLALVGCGGDSAATGPGGSDLPGGGSGSGLSGVTQQSISSSNAVNLTSVIMGSTNLSGSAMSSAVNSAGSRNDMAQVDAVVELVEDQVAAIAGTVNLNGAQSKSLTPKQTQTITCPSGGNMVVTVTQSGSTNAQGTIVFNSCKQESNSVMDGSMQVAQNGDRSEITIPTLTMESGQANMSLQNSKFITDDSTNYSYMKMTGTFSVPGGNQIQSASFKDYVSESQYSSGKTTVTQSGLIKSGCMSGWVAVATPTALEFTGNSDCPSKGVLTYTGSNSSVLKLSVGQDGTTINLYLNDSMVKTYASCNDMEPDTSSCPTL